jgi:hypothetical protein
VGVCNIGFDIRSMQHEQLYTRLYMSWKTEKFKKIDPRWM